MAQSESQARSMTYYLLNLDDKLYSVARLATADPDNVLVPAEALIQAVLADAGRDPLDAAELAKFGAAAAKYPAMEPLIDDDVKRVKTFAKKLATDAAGKEYEGKLVDMGVHQRRHVPMLPLRDFAKLARKFCNLDEDDLPETLAAEDPAKSFVDGIKFRGRNRGGVEHEPAPAKKRTAGQRDQSDDSDSSDRAEAASPSPKKKAKTAAAATAAPTAANGDAPQPKRRGRPPKNPEAVAAAASAAAAGTPTPPKKVGRPPKAKPQADAMDVDDTGAVPKAKRTRKVSQLNDDETDQIAPTPPRATSAAASGKPNKLDPASVSLNDLADMLATATGEQLQAAQNAMQDRLRKLEQMRADQRKAKQMLLEMQKEENDMQALLKAHESTVSASVDKMFAAHAVAATKESRKSSKKSAGASAKDTVTPKAAERNAAVSAGPLSPTPQAKGTQAQQPPAASPAKTPVGSSAAEGSKKKKRGKRSKNVTESD
ncbi:hypothetical protein BCR44DRAFT_80364 [Catenaria anguillulae PL171]|uniref:Uncharacterized protein n=1 Tax=Catenaria anguillulae PL171 TaxID=765915 RepID=A0A1Y2HD37_9FUNG|nr:hypothetical protein BCR44DRAFT_80364 [Catenaria anguillulae PL171]